MIWLTKRRHNLYPETTKFVFNKKLTSNGIGQCNGRSTKQLLPTNSDLFWVFYLAWRLQPMSRYKAEYHKEGGYRWHDTPHTKDNQRAMEIRYVGLASQDISIQKYLSKVLMLQIYSDQYKTLIIKYSFQLWSLNMYFGKWYKQETSVNCPPAHCGV